MYKTSSKSQTIELVGAMNIYRCALYSNYSKRKKYFSSRLIFVNAYETT